MVMSETTAPRAKAYEPGQHPALPPPPGTVGVVGWIRANLFSSPLNIALTLITLYALYKIVPAVIAWLVTDSYWSGSGPMAEWSNKDCREADGHSIGACWLFIRARFEQFIFGFYGGDGSLIRPILFMIGLPIAVLPLLFDNLPYRKELLLFSFLYPFLSLILLTGGYWSPGTGIFFLVSAAACAGIGCWLVRSDLSETLRAFSVIAYGFFGIFFIIGLVAISGIFGLNEVETSKWGGLLLVLVLGVTGIALSLPIGVVLALGRRSSMPAIRILSIIFIEFIRAVPLITLLFMASNMLPLFLPEGVTFDKLIRVLILVVAFASAYMAEVVRGGLAAIPKGQFEAAEALGLSYWKMMNLIVLPQALKIVIPGIVNTFIGLFKDTTLVLIIGLLDLLGVARAAIADAKWIGLSTTAYVFIAIIFFVFCFSMSRYSIYLENKLHTGHKR